MPAIPQPNDEQPPPKRRSTDRRKVRAKELFAAPVPDDERERMIREASDDWDEQAERLARIRRKRGC